MTITTAKLRKLTDRASKREEAARKKRLAAAAKAIAEEEKAEKAAPAIQREAIVARDGTVLRGTRLEFDGRTVHRANPIRTMAVRSRNREHALFRKEHADATDRLILAWDLSQGGISSGVSQYEPRSASAAQTGMISEGKLRTVNDQIESKREIEALRTYFGESWNILHAICILGVPIVTWAEKVKMKEEPAAGYVCGLLDRLVSFYSPPKEGRTRIRTIEFSTQEQSST